MNVIWGFIEGALVIGGVMVLWAIAFLLIAWFFRSPHPATWYDTNDPYTLDERGSHD